jgi:hypothetical protein
VHQYAVWSSGGRCTQGGDGGAGGDGSGGAGGAGGSGIGGDDGGSGGAAPDPGIVQCDWQFIAAQIPENAAIWTEALVGDFTGDGRPDVVTARESRAGGYHAVDFLVSGPTSILSAIPAPTERAPRGLTAADFDGDAILDVAFVVPRTHCTEDDEVFVVFGGPHPSAPVRVAELGGVLNVAAGPLLFQPDFFDGIADLGVSSSCDVDGDGPGEPRHAAAVLLGGDDRRLESPYPLNDSFEEGRTLYATGDFTGDGHPDLLAVAPVESKVPLEPGPEQDAYDARPDIGVWLMEAHGDGDLPNIESIDAEHLGSRIPNLQPARQEGQGDQGTAPRSRLLQRGGLAVADLDPCDPEVETCSVVEAALFLSSEDTGGDVDADRGVPRLYVLRAGKSAEVVPADPSACPELGAQEIPEEIFEKYETQTNFALTSKTTEALATDLDGDGLAEVVGWWIGPAGEVDVNGKLPPDAGRTGGAAVFWNDETTGLGSACAEPLPVPTGEVVVRIAAFPGNPRDPAIVVATGRAVRLLRVGDDHAALAACGDGGDASRCDVVYEVSADDVGSEIRDVAVLDFDLDGLDDLVVVRNDGVELIAQRSRDEQASEESSSGEQVASPVAP